MELWPLRLLSVNDNDGDDVDHGENCKSYKSVKRKNGDGENKSIYFCYI